MWIVVGRLLVPRLSFRNDHFLNLVTDVLEVAAMGYSLLSCLEGGEWFMTRRDRGGVGGGGVLFCLDHATALNGLMI